MRTTAYGLVTLAISVLSTTASGIALEVLPVSAISPVLYLGFSASLVGLILWPLVHLKKDR